MHVVEVRDLRKEFDFRYGISKRRYVLAVESLSFEISKGEVFSLLGPNGAGKSTTIKMISTLISPTSGDAIIAGHSVIEEPEKVRECTGVMLAGERSMYWKLTARENLEYFSTLYHIGPDLAKKRIEELLELVSLKEHADRRVETFSTGMRIRLSFAKALLNDAPVILLDEPTASLDPQAARSVRESILNLKEQGKAILLTTHNMEEADRLSDRVGVIDHGKLIAIGSPSQLKRAYAESRTFRIRLMNPRGVQEALSSVTGVESIVQTSESPSESTFEVTTESGMDIGNSILRSLARENMQVENFNLVEPTLEDVFIKLTGRTLRD